jgi:hypothetical protein
LAYKFGRLNAQKLIYYKNYIYKRNIFAGIPFISYILLSNFLEICFNK